MIATLSSARPLRTTTGVVGVRRVECIESCEASAVGQRQVEEHQVGAVFTQVLESAGQAIGHADVDGVGGTARIAQHLADEARIAGIVLDQQRAYAGAGRRFGGHDLLGSVTMVSQKSSIDLTTLMNCSRSTGLVM